MKTLPEKSPLPNFRGGCLSDLSCDWCKRYFDVGDKIDYFKTGKESAVHGAITAIKRNKYGRISYLVGDDYVLVEDIFSAMSILKKSAKKARR